MNMNTCLLHGAQHVFIILKWLIGMQSPLEQNLGTAQRLCLLNFINEFLKREQLAALLFRCLEKSAELAG